MPKHKIDEAREERIQMEIVVDCYNESERYSGWICYLEDKLEFPFRARSRREKLHHSGLYKYARPSTCYEFVIRKCKMLADKASQQ
jgi:hypothetical protein